MIAHLIILYRRKAVRIARNLSYDTANRLLSGLISGTTPQYAYSYDPASNLTSITPNGPQQSYSCTSTNAITTGTYDVNGSPTALGGNAYTWDGANRVVSFANSANHTSSTFTYDGLSRLVRVVDSTSGTVTADHSYSWCGAMRCLAHDNTQSGSPVSAQYFTQGVIASGTSYYYVQDKLRSVTQVITTSGTVATQYAYDPYGNRTTVSGTVVSDIGYSGYFNHASSGLAFALYRVYDPAHARWLNRDPIWEAGGINLYAYVRGNPISLRDPLGLCPPDDSTTINSLPLYFLVQDELSSDDIQTALDAIQEQQQALDRMATDQSIAQSTGNWSNYTLDKSDLATANTKYYKAIHQAAPPDPTPPDPVPPPGSED
jgi:RHS repeat-associated protein